MDSNKTAMSSNSTKRKGVKKATTKIIQTRREFFYGSVVSIDRRDMDEYRWKDRNEVPTSLGIVQNPDHFDDREAEEIDEQIESYVSFALCGHYPWLDSDSLVMAR